jgi:hypothetical protein
MHRRDDHGDVNRLDDQVLDDLLRAWHDQSTERALRAEAGRPRVTPVAAPVRAQVSRPSIIGRLRPFVTHPGVRGIARHSRSHRGLAAAAFGHEGDGRRHPCSERRASRGA